jgi:hypothetical protein
MLQSIDHHYLRLAGRFDTYEAFDPAAMHRRELVRLLREDRETRRLAQMRRLRDWITRRLLQRRTATQVKHMVEEYRSC